MNVRCPNCQTVFRVDPARVPHSGVRARCSRCQHPFVIRPPEAAPEAATPPGAEASHQPAAPVVTHPTPATAAAPAAPAAAAPAPAPAAPATPPAPAAPAAPAPARTPIFGSRDPNARAQRIARALVSDIVAYNRKKVEETAAAGTMRTEFREEIMKSWEEYVAQVGIELAKGTPYFRDALNEILARGRQVF